jgi:hypothetical protein
VALSRHIPKAGRKVARVILEESNQSLLGPHTLESFIQIPDSGVSTLCFCGEVVITLDDLEIGAPQIKRISIEMIYNHSLVTFKTKKKSCDQHSALTVLHQSNLTICQADRAVSQQREIVAVYPDNLPGIPQGDASGVTIKQEMGLSSAYGHFNTSTAPP